MTTLGEIFRRFGPAYRARFGHSLSPSQRQAMQALEACRTEALGGHIYACPSCQFSRYSYHSCRNRHCPTCQQDATQAWLAEQQALLLSVPYFLVTFTLPSELRAIARQHPETIYPLLFRTSAAALQQLAQAPRFLGGQIGMLGVLQTWTREMRYHPHVHYLVPALALTPDGKRWLVGNSDFLVHLKPLGELFRAKFHATLRQTAWAGQVDARVWAKPWVVDCRPIGSGTSALKYLAPYIFRIALSNNRIEHVANDTVTFRYTEGKTGAQKRATLPVDVFIGRFLAHVLPKGFVKVRYYGLLAVGKRKLLAEVRSILALRQAVPPPPRIATAPEPLVVPPKDAGGSDTASQATARAAGDDGGRAIEPWPTTRRARALVSVTTLPGSLGAPGRWCASQPRSPPHWLFYACQLLVQVREQMPGAGLLRFDLPPYATLRASQRQAWS